MADWTIAHWEASHEAPLPRDRRGGRYRAYSPDPLIARPLEFDAELNAQAARVEGAVRTLMSGQTAPSLEGLSRFLLRSEAIASSRIEGLQVSVQQVALAELSQTEGATVRGFTQNARLVANNITALRRATTGLADAPSVTIDGIADLHTALLPQHEPPGLRGVQNWIGGNDWHPLGADFVPPIAERVEPLMADLAEYVTGAVHAPLVQAGLAHAQFETIHPFTDGNGRVGRALIHTVLTRRGLTHGAILPVSMVMLTHSDAYVAGLSAYRYAGPPDSAEARAGITAWLATFLAAVEVAVDIAAGFAVDLEALQASWAERHRAHRERDGLRGRPRAGSAVARLLSLLPEAPLVTARTVQRLVGASFPAARAAAEELADARILSRKQVDHGATGYLAREVFDLVTFAERRLASTRWDTRQSRPIRPVPARPH